MKFIINDPVGFKVHIEISEDIPTADRLRIALKIYDQGRSQGPMVQALIDTTIRDVLLYDK